MEQQLYNECKQAIYSAMQRQECRIGEGINIQSAKGSSAIPSPYFMECARIMEQQGLLEAKSQTFYVLTEKGYGECYG